MITLIEARRFRSLRYISQPLGPFHVLVGPNASGKTTFLDVVAFLGRLVSEGVEAAVSERTHNFVDLIWRRGELDQEDSKQHPHSDMMTEFELAVEAEVPDEVTQKHFSGSGKRIRYEVQIGLLPDSGELAILQERVFLIPIPGESYISLFPPDFPSPSLGPGSIMHPSKAGWKRVVSKSSGKKDNYSPELKQDNGKAWVSSFKLGHRRSALGMLPDDDQFPASMWLKSLLVEGVQQFVLNSVLIRKPSPPNQRRGFSTDGSNLPWVVSDLKHKHPEQFRNWIAHLRTALPDIVDVSSVARAEDRHAYLQVQYRPGFWVPSWMVSDGTLRMMALTLPAYLPDFEGIYLIEEPENGIHPKAIETVYQSLSSVYDAQILLATHSPIILSQAKPSEVLCFAKDESGATDVISGDRHPRLKEWHGEASLGSLLAAGVLG